MQVVEELNLEIEWTKSMLHNHHLQKEVCEAESDNSSCGRLVEIKFPKKRMKGIV